MRQRGRPSTASMMAVMPGDRPAPPDELQPDEAAEWNRIVDRMPPDWFTAETHPVLIQFCRQICMARRVAAQLADCEATFVVDEKGISIRPKGWFDDYRELVRLNNQTAMVVGNLATKMRLTPQSRYDSKIAAGGATKTVGRPKPWMMMGVDDEQPDAN